MTPQFNLIDSPWILVHTLEGEVRQVGLLEALAQAHRFRALAETSPVNLVGLHRLLAALLADIEAAKRMPIPLAEAWELGFPEVWLREYFDTHWDRFWLFHATHPFMQVPDLLSAEETGPAERRKPWTQLAPERANGNTPSVFDHSVDTDPEAITAAEAARFLVGFLQCTPGGLVKVFRTSDRAGPVADSAVVVPLGDCLARTLLLCTPPVDDPRFPYDRVSWRFDPPDVAVLRKDQDLPSLGPRDRFTRLTRAVLLEHIGEKAVPMVRWIRYGAGLAFAEDPGDRDPMVAYRMGAKSLIRLGFEEGRAVWRDLAALLPDPSGRYSRPPDVLNWSLARLEDVCATNDSQVPLLVAGLASNQAKVERWRVAEFRLPLPLIRDAALASLFRDELGVAEATSRRLRDIAGRMVVALLPGVDSRHKRENAYGLRDQLPTLWCYFATLERELPAFLAAIAKSDVDDAICRWRVAQATAVRNAWDATVQAVGTSGRALRAIATAEGDMQRLVRELSRPVVDHEIRSEEVHA